MRTRHAGGRNGIGEGVYRALESKYHCLAGDTAPSSVLRAAGNITETCGQRFRNTTEAAVTRRGDRYDHFRARGHRRVIEGPAGSGVRRSWGGHIAGRRVRLRGGIRVNRDLDISADRGVTSIVIGQRTNERNALPAACWGR